MKELIMSKEDFLQFYENIHGNKEFDLDFLYSLLKDIIESYYDHSNNFISGQFKNINAYVLFLYVYNEYLFFVDNLKNKSLEELNKDEKLVMTISSISLDKYLTNEKIDINENYYGNKYTPSISTLSLYLNFMGKISSQFSKNNPNVSLVSDLLMKCIKISKCSLDLLIDGFESEAFSTWRTLHETECILAILIKYQEPVLKKYLQHMNYSLAYRKIIKDQDKLDEIFEEIKQGMREKNLKSKDMKKYIEYGYLYAIEDFANSESPKLNFRDGVEKYAGLSNYSKLYEYSSEIAHSSPLMIYSNEYALFHLTLICLYETFFRIEKIFSSHLLKVSLNQTFKDNYIKMRNIYFAFLVSIYNKEKEIYKNINIKNSK